MAITKIPRETANIIVALSILANTQLWIKRTARACSWKRNNVFGTAEVEPMIDYRLNNQVAYLFDTGYIIDKQFLWLSKP